LLYLILSIFLIPQSTILGASYHLLSILQQLRSTTTTLYPSFLIEAARHGPAVGVIPVLIPLNPYFNK
jgi:hypothetical protein